MLKIDQLFTRPADKQAGNAPFEQPLDLLHSCHEKILHFSSALLKLNPILQQEGWCEHHATSADQIRRYFNVAAPEHHKDEEEHLFPAIIALDPEFKKPDTTAVVQLINRMIKEHVESDALWATLDNLLAERSEDFEQLEMLSKQFAGEMRKHAETENAQIFPFAKAHISDAAFKKMGAAIARRRGIKPSAL